MQTSSVTGSQASSDAGFAHEEPPAPLELGNFAGRVVGIPTGEQLPELRAPAPHARGLVVETAPTQVEPQVAEELSKQKFRETLNLWVGEQTILTRAYSLDSYFEELKKSGKVDVAVELVSVSAAHLADPVKSSPGELTLNQQKLLTVLLTYKVDALEDLGSIFKSSPKIGMELIESVNLPVEIMVKDLHGWARSSSGEALKRFDYIRLALPEVEKQLEVTDFIFVLGDLPLASNKTLSGLQLGSCATPQQFEEIVRFCRSFPGVDSDKILFSFNWDLDYRTTMEIIKDANSIGPEKLKELISHPTRSQQDLEIRRNIVALWKVYPDETFRDLNIALRKGLAHGTRKANVDAILKVYADREAINSSDLPWGRGPIKTLADAIRHYLD